MVENAIGVFGLPLAVAANFVVDEMPVLVPMVIEEPSVVAAASRIAKLVALNGGFRTEVDEPLMMGQIQLVGVADIDAAQARLEAEKLNIVAKANVVLASLVARGGGCVELQTRVLPPLHAGEEPFLMVELIIHCCDAMGANLMNTAL
jgi:hydroxymethylglutaryl-CoA reductase